jgi:hypothetical protein
MRSTDTSSGDGHFDRLQRTLPRDGFPVFVRLMRLAALLLSSFGAADVPELAVAMEALLVAVLTLLRYLRWWCWWCWWWWWWWWWWW